MIPGRYRRKGGLPTRNAKQRAADERKRAERERERAAREAARPLPGILLTFPLGPWQVQAGLPVQVRTARGVARVGRVVFEDGTALVGIEASPMGEWFAGQLKAGPLTPGGESRTTWQPELRQEALWLRYKAPRLRVTVGKQA